MFRGLLMVTLWFVMLPVRVAGDSNTDLAAAALAARIDKLLGERWTAAGAEPAPLADDAEFLRRVTLDVTGKIPIVADAREFLEDNRPEKRRRLVQRLLQSPGYKTHFTNVWRAVFIGDKDPQGLGLQAAFEVWMASRLLENTGYDRMAREILTVPMVAANSRGNQLGGQLQGAVSFYLANENKPENLAGSTARLFLGVKLECAQCHDHPFARWKKEQFWQYAAFFGSPGQKGKPRQIAIPNTNKTAQGRFLDGAEPKWKDGTDPRATLADWMLAPDNPYFARATVNRVWSFFFGAGIVERLDDLTRETEKTPLLDVLAQNFAEHRYDLKYLIEAIVTSRAYGRTSRMTHPSQKDPLLFARMQVRGLAPEQFFDSLLEATGLEPGNGAARLDFLGRFANATERPAEVQTSILQALALMNGKFIADATSLSRSTTLLAVMDAPFLDSAGRIEALYLAALSRKPRAEESTRLVKYVSRGGPSGNARQGLADVFWALLNSSEFLFNH